MKNYVVIVMLCLLTTLAKDTVTMLWTRQAGVKAGYDVVLDGKLMAATAKTRPGSAGIRKLSFQEHSYDGRQAGYACDTGERVCRRSAACEESYLSEPGSA